jgi:hypothetical protein
MSKSGFVNEIGREYIFPHIQLALDKANEIVRKSEEGKRYKSSLNAF